MRKYKFSDFVNVKTATAGAIIMGSMVYYVNREFGWESATIAALKQAVYTFFFGGACVRLSEVIAVKISRKWLGILLGTLAASIVTITAVYLIHLIKGTPLPLESTLPTILLAPPSFIILAWYYRVQTDKKRHQAGAKSM